MDAISSIESETHKRVMTLLARGQADQDTLENNPNHFDSPSNKSTNYEKPINRQSALFVSSFDKPERFKNNNRYKYKR